LSFDIQINNQTGVFDQLDHDIMLDGVGSPIILTGQNKLIQDIQKILFTTKNYFYTTYGTNIESLVGTNIGVDKTKSQLAEQVTNSLVYLQYLQNQQSQYQKVNANEIIGTIDSITVNYLPEIQTQNTSPSDVFTFRVAISITTAAQKPIVVTNNLSLA
jgi:hypothetical protein